MKSDAPGDEKFSGFALRDEMCAQNFAMAGILLTPSPFIYVQIDFSGD